MYVLHAITVQQTNLQQDKLHVVLFVSSSLNVSELQPQQYNTLHVRVIETKSIQYSYNIKMSQQFVR